MNQNHQLKESGHSQSLAVAAALAMLGVSVGVNVQELLAASPPEQMQSNQVKIPNDQVKGGVMQNKVPSVQDKALGSAQIKIDSTQQKLPAMQFKEQGNPGVKPVDPIRR